MASKTVSTFTSAFTKRDGDKHLSADNVNGLEGQYCIATEKLDGGQVFFNYEKVDDRWKFTDVFTHNETPIHPKSNYNGSKTFANAVEEASNDHLRWLSERKDATGNKARVYTEFMHPKSGNMFRLSSPTKPDERYPADVLNKAHAFEAWYEVKHPDGSVAIKKFRKGEPSFTFDRAVPIVSDGIFHLEFLKNLCSHLRQNYTRQEGLILYFPYYDTDDDENTRGFKLLTGTTYNRKAKDVASLRSDYARNYYWEVITDMRVHTLPPRCKNTTTKEAVVSVVRKVVQQGNWTEKYLRFMEQPESFRNAELLQLTETVIEKAASYMVKNGLFCGKKQDKCVLNVKCQIILATLNIADIFEEI